MLKRFNMAEGKIIGSLFLLTAQGRRATRVTRPGVLLTYEISAVQFHLDAV